MAIITLSRDWGSDPSLVRIVTTDSLSTITTDGYLTTQASVIEAINYGAFFWEDDDLIVIKYSDGDGFFRRDEANQKFVPFAPDSGATGLINVFYEDTNGAGTFTPNPLTNSFYAIIIGAGGGGGGAASSTGGASAGGGGGAGARIDIFVDNPASSYAYTVGATGGGGSIAGGNGADGGDTVFAGFTAPGGSGGDGGTAIVANAPKISAQQAFGAGVSAPGSVQSLQGGNGEEGIVFEIGANVLLKVGAGGQAAGYNGSFQNAYADSTSPATRTGNPGANPGNGGSGGYSINNASGRGGGNGQNGAILIYEYS